jgi:hypothetical protein
MCPRVCFCTDDECSFFVEQGISLLHLWWRVQVVSLAWDLECRISLFLSTSFFIFHFASISYFDAECSMISFLCLVFHDLILLNVESLTHSFTPSSFKLQNQGTRRIPQVCMSDAASWARQR